MRVHFYITYDQEDFQYKIRYLFITYRMKDKKPGKDKKDKKGKKKENKPAVSDFIKNFNVIFEYAKKLITSILSKSRIDRIHLHLDIISEDAAQTAIEYGEACAAIYTALSFFRNFIDIKHQDIQIKPIFQNFKVMQSSYIEFSCHASIRLGSLTAAFIKLITMFLSETMKRNMAQKQVKNSVKS